MDFTVVRYSVKEGREKENRSLVEKVFGDLERNGPAHLHYLVLDLQDGNFLHIAAGDTKSLTETAAFKVFSANHAERRSGPLSRSEAKLIGNYHMLSNPA